MSEQREQAAWILCAFSVVGMLAFGALWWRAPAATTQPPATQRRPDELLLGRWAVRSMSLVPGQPQTAAQLAASSNTTDRPIIRTYERTRLVIDTGDRTIFKDLALGEANSASRSITYTLTHDGTTARNVGLFFDDGRTFVELNEMSKEAGGLIFMSIMERLPNAP